MLVVVGRRRGVEPEWRRVVRWWLSLVDFVGLLFVCAEGCGRTAEEPAAERGADMASAALGGSVEVPTIDGGRLKINYDPGKQKKKRFQYKSQ